MIDYKLPDICGRCGGPAQTTVSDTLYRTRVYTMTDGFRQTWSTVTMPGFLMPGATFPTTTYEVSVCYRCKERMTRDVRLFKLANIAGLALMAVTLLGVFGDQLPTIALVCLSIVVLLTALRLVFKPNLGSFDGHYFEFRNKAYQAEFAQRNPNKVRLTDSR